MILIDKWHHWMTGSANLYVKFGIFTLQKQSFSQTWIAMFLGPTLFSAALLETSGQLSLALSLLTLSQRWSDSTTSPDCVPRWFVAEVRQI